jgi:histidinol-phosphate phosphatase family protein
MRAQLAAAGAHLDDIFVCPHDEGACDCRKPRPGLIEQARAKWDIDLSRSAMIGDSDVDRQLAARCGLRFIRVDEGVILEAPQDASLPPADG